MRPNDPYFNKLIRWVPWEGGPRERGWDTGRAQALRPARRAALRLRPTIAGATHPPTRSIMATRCMTQAVYFSSGELSEPEYSHYGLAAPLYTHFTSPIRRRAWGLPLIKGGVAGRAVAWGAAAARCRAAAWALQPAGVCPPLFFRSYADVVVHRVLMAALGLRPLPPSMRDREGVRAMVDNLNVRHRWGAFLGGAGTCGGDGARMPGACLCVRAGTPHLYSPKSTLQKCADGRARLCRAAHAHLLQGQGGGGGRSRNQGDGWAPGSGGEGGPSLQPSLAPAPCHGQTGDTQQPRPSHRFAPTA